MIPTVALSEVQAAPQLAPRANEQALNAGNRAIGQAGAALSDVGSMLGRFAIAKQEQVNKGYLAGEENVRLGTEAEIRAFTDPRKNPPETWDKFKIKARKTYQQGMSKRAKDQGWSPEVIKANQQLAESQFTRWDIEYNRDKDKAMIAQSNARLESNANMHLSSGNIKGAMASVDSMTLYPEQRVEMVKRMTNTVVAGRYERELTDLTTRLPADQIKGLAAMESDLSATDKEGVPVNGWVNDESGKRIGGLEFDTRTNLLQSIRTQKHAVDTGMVRRFAGIAKAYEEGGMETGDAAMANALNAGDVTPEFAQSMEGAMKGAFAKGQEERMKTATAEQKAAMVEQRRQLSNFQQLRGKLDELTPKRIKEDLDAGNLSESQAAQLRAGLSGTAVVEMGLPELKDARGNKFTGKDPRSLLTDYGKNAIVSGKDASMEEREGMLNAIGKAPVSVETKAQMMQELIKLFDVDFRQEEKYPPSDSIVGVNINASNGVPVLSWRTKSGRKINKNERAVRGSLYRTLSQSKELGEAWTVAALTQAERDIAAFYDDDNYGNMSLKNIEDFNRLLVKRIADQGSLEILKGITSQ